MKIYARQVPPEHQESPLMLFDEYPDGLILDGNRYYNSHTTHEYDLLMRYIDDASAEVEDIVKKTGFSAYSTVTEAITTFFPPPKGKYNTKHISKWKQILLKYRTCNRRDEDDVVCAALELITGQPYVSGTIRGCCQSDWQEYYAPADMDMQYFEIEYFNLGSEWIVHDEDDVPAGPDEINGYSIYCYSSNSDDIRKEIAENAGVVLDDVVLYEFERYTHVPVYRIA